MNDQHSGKDFARIRQIWTDQVGDDHTLSPMAFKVAYHLSHYFNRDQFLDAGCMNAWPSYDALAGKCGCGISTVKRAINELRARKHIETSGGRGRSQTLQYRAKIKPRVAVNGDTNDPNKTMQNWTVNEEKEFKSASEKSSNLHEKEVRYDLQPLLNKPIDKNTGAREADRAVSLHPASVDAQCEPYNPEWALVVFEGLSRERARLPTPANKFLHQRIVVDRIHADVMEHQAKHGWPAINSMFEWPRAIELGSVPPAIRKMALEMEPVRNGSALWDDWRAEFRARGWPFPSEAKHMSFPRGGPDALDAFMQRLGAMRDGFADNVVAFMQATGS